MLILCIDGLTMYLPVRVNHWYPVRCRSEKAWFTVHHWKTTVLQVAPLWAQTDENLWVLSVDYKVDHVGLSCYTLKFLVWSLNFCKYLQCHVAKSHHSSINPAKLKETLQFRIINDANDHLYLELGQFLLLNLLSPFWDFINSVDSYLCCDYIK